MSVQLVGDNIVVVVRSTAQHLSSFPLDSQHSSDVCLLEVKSICCSEPGAIAPLLHAF